MEARDNQSVDQTPTWEKVVGSFGFVVLCMGIAYLCWSAWSDEKLPPDIAITVNSIKPISKGFLVKINVVNNGSEAVSLLQVEGQLTNSGGETEASTAELDYLASYSTGHAGLFFTTDPRQGDLQLRPLGFQPP